MILDAIIESPASQALRASPPLVSLILPTFNRKESLRALLECLKVQTEIASTDYEICIGDDGSCDGSAQMVREWSLEHTLRIRYHVSEENHGPASARNHACSLASGEIWVIIGDDIEPPPDFLSRHLAWHRAHPEVEAALLGRVVWPSFPPPTRFMRWLEGRGRRFYFVYPDISCRVPPEQFYTCNVSLKKELAMRCKGFREDFPYASHEDLEYGVRLAQEQGMQLFFDTTLTATHRHQLTPSGTVRRVYLNGRSSVLYWQIVPDASSKVTKALKSMLRILSAWVPMRWMRKHADAVPPMGWFLLFMLAYWKGVHDQRAAVKCKEVL
jgi:glycosyltransferase involved in cell wall biosynthesis